MHQVLLDFTDALQNLLHTEKKAVICNHNLDKLQRKEVCQLRQLILEFLNSQDRILTMAEHKLDHFGGDAQLCSALADSCQSHLRVQHRQG